VEALVGLSPEDDRVRILLQGHYETIQRSVQTAKWYIHFMAGQQAPGFRKLRAI
jgi:hypothetical protein